MAPVIAQTPEKYSLDFIRPVNSTNCVSRILVLPSLFLKTECEVLHSKSLVQKRNGCERIFEFILIDSESEMRTLGAIFVYIHTPYPFAKENGTT